VDAGRQTCALLTDRTTDRNPDRFGNRTDETVRDEVTDVTDNRRRQRNRRNDSHFLRWTLAIEYGKLITTSDYFITLAKIIQAIRIALFKLLVDNLHIRHNILRNVLLST
jgi:hypothetical protein